MNRHTVLARISLLLASILGSINVASGSWLITDGEPGKVTASEKISSDSTKAVCYIKETGVYYTSLDRALEVAEKERPNEADTICVIPNLGFDVTIAKSHIVESVDSLVLPYEYGGTLIACGKNVDTGDEIEDQNAINGGTDVVFADQDAESVSKYRQTKVVLNAGVQLTVNGSLLIGGKLGRPAQGVSGGTAGSYCEIVLSDNAGIVCSGAKANIKCDGYIKRAAKDNGSTLQITNGGTLISPLVVYDYKGGSCTKASVTATNPFSPFYIFDFPNIQVKTQVDFGAYWTSKTCLWVDTLKYYVPVEGLNFIAPFTGTAKPILIQKSGSITVDYVPADSDNLYTSSGVDGTKTSIEVTGKVDIGAMSFTFYGTPVDSSEFYLPISYRLALTLESGSDKEPSVMNVPNKVKFMNGSSVTIKKGATVEVTAPMAIYGSDFKDEASGTSLHYPIITKDGTAIGASFVNNGTLNASGEGVIGGFIDTTSKDGSASINYGATVNSISSSEASVYSGSFFSTTVTTSDYDCSVTGNLPCDSEGNFSSSEITWGSYESASNAKSEYGWSLIKTLSGVTIEEVDGSEGQNENYGYVQVKAVTNPMYLSGVSYSNWTFTSTSAVGDGSVNIAADDSVGATATIKNTSSSAIIGMVSVTAGGTDYSSFSGSLENLEVDGKIVDITGVTVSVESTGYTYKGYASTGPKTVNGSNSANITTFNFTASPTPSPNNSKITEYIWGVYSDKKCTKAMQPSATLTFSGTTFNYYYYDSFKMDTDDNSKPVLKVPDYGGSRSSYCYYYIGVTIKFTDSKGNQKEVNNLSNPFIVASANKPD